MNYRGTIYMILIIVSKNKQIGMDG
jgi:hypothetical protein